MSNSPVRVTADTGQVSLANLICFASPFLTPQNGPIGSMAAPRPPHLVASAKRWLRRAKGSEKKEEKATRARRGASASAPAAAAAAAAS